MPAYAGALPSTMLTHAMVMGRDIQLAGDAWQGAEEGSVLLGRSGTRIKARSDDRRYATWQPSVRGLLVDVDLQRGIGVSLQKGKAVVRAAGDLCILARPSETELARQMAAVLSFADLRAERVNEILAQVVPASAQFAAIAGLQPDRHKYTFELIGAALRLANRVAQQVKHLLDVPRPVELSPLVQPIILTPGHASYPSGHAAEATCVAEVLAALHASDDELAEWSTPVGRLTPQHGLRCQLHRLAYRIAENRVVAGVHMPIDSLAGQALGLALASHLLGLATGGAASRVAFEPSEVEPQASQSTARSGSSAASDASVHLLALAPRLDAPLLEAAGMELLPPPSESEPAVNPEPRAALAWLFRQARAECLGA